MIIEYIDAWRNRKEDFREWLKNDVNANTIEYFEILKGVIEIVINPSLENRWSKLDITKIHVIDDGDYQGTTIYLIPKDTYQPYASDYIWTHNYYGSCSG